MAVNRLLANGIFIIVLPYRAGLERSQENGTQAQSHMHDLTFPHRYEEADRGVSCWPQSCSADQTLFKPRLLLLCPAPARAEKQ